MIWILWIAPEPGWIKINTNGAANDFQCLGGCGGVSRISKGFVKSYFQVPLGLVYAFEAKIVAIIHALEFARNIS